ncbi:MAG TPA: hypothetical protein P5511_10235, partial [Candidatus Goldiibacteriota bacterium]|nr:hypothetical protein [Candidatus Goldiibacteriota bacterium]
MRCCLRFLPALIAFFCAALNAAEYAPAPDVFNKLPEKCVKACFHKKISKAVMQDLSPLDLEGRWYFKIGYKERQKEVRDVIGMIEYTKDIDGIKHYFYGVPLENKGNLIRFSADSAHIRNLKFPVFSFIFLDVELSPPIKYVKFPMAPGDEWAENSTGLIDVLGLFKVKMKTTAKFRVTAVEDVPVDGRMIHVYKIENLITRGDDGK